jgi:type I restriction enzyme R subunit
MNENSEARLVEQPTIELFAELGYETVNAYKEIDGVNILGRETTSEVVLVARLRAALQRLNPALPAEAIKLAIEELTRPRNVLSLVNANREVYRLRSSVSSKLRTSR